MSNVQVVWLKRDIRIRDHAPLWTAAQNGPVIVMYVVEPSIWTFGDLSKRHLQFVIESLTELDEELRLRGARLYTAVAEIDEVLDGLYATYGAFELLAHEENGMAHTFARDRRVHRWMKERGLSWTEFQLHGVKRRLQDRNHFQTYWEAHMNQPCYEIPQRLAAPSVQPPSLLVPSVDPLRRVMPSVPGSLMRPGFGQRGGERKAQTTFNDFLERRYVNYSYHLSKPHEAERSCSRISAYLAWGNLSMREAVQRSHAATERVPERTRRQLYNYISRLHWHCHFIQRIEDDVSIASETMNPVYEGVRQENEHEFAMWWMGRTGYPLVDASMRALHETGWLHFRGRAMVTSFICNTLLHDWRRVAQGLAQLFLDYEPGIHYSQIQMQAGTTGFNTIRIYNPVKMSKEHDPQGVFIRTFIPELRNAPPEKLHEPWLEPPLVPLEQANRHAREVLWGLRNSTEAREHASQLLRKHGSRLRQKSRSRLRATSSIEQLELEF